MAAISNKLQTVGLSKQLWTITCNLFPLFELVASDNWKLWGHNYLEFMTETTYFVQLKPFQTFSDWGSIFCPIHERSVRCICRTSNTSLRLTSWTGPQPCCPVWSESSLCTHWVAKDLSFLQQMPRLIWIFVWRTVILLVLSWGSSNVGIFQISAVLM